MGNRAFSTDEQDSHAEESSLGSSCIGSETEHGMMAKTVPTGTGQATTGNHSKMD